MKGILIILAVLVAALAACTGGDTVSLKGTEWTLVSKGSTASPEPVLAGTEIALEFAESGDGLSGSGGCNGYSGTYRTSGDDFEILELSFTEIGCFEPEGILAQEMEFFDDLVAATTLEVDGPELTISSAGGRTLVFKQDGS